MTEEYTKIVNTFLHPQEPVPDWDKRRAGKELQLEDLPAEKKRIHKDHIAPDITLFPEENPSMADSYREMLALCQEKGLRAVLVTPPYTAEYLECYEEYDPDFFPVFRHFMSKLTEDYGAPWLDYSGDSAFSRQYDLFADIDHLNQAGAELFNAQFYADAQALGLLR